MEFKRVVDEKRLYREAREELERNVQGSFVIPTDAAQSIFTRVHLSLLGLDGQPNGEYDVIRFDDNNPSLVAVVGQSVVKDDWGGGMRDKKYYKIFYLDGNERDSFVESCLSIKTKLMMTEREIK